MQVAARLENIGQSVIREMTRLALAHGAINLSQGYADFPAPAEIKEAAIQAILADQNQYAITWGVPELRRAIAAKMARLYNLHFDPEVHVTVTCGVTEAITVSLMAMLNPGDEIIIVEPFHENFYPAARFAGAIPVMYTLEPPDYRLDPDRLKRLFSPHTRAILINTPHNPTGRVFNREELAGVASLCQEFDAVAVTDEIYEFITYDGHEHIPLATLPGMAERTVTIGGMSKTFAVTGWRLGYVCAPEPLANAIRAVHDFTTICAATPLQYAAAAALNLPDSYYSDLRQAYTQRRDLMMSILWDCGFQAKAPEGAYYVMADFTGLSATRGLPENPTEFAMWMTKEVGVAVVPGHSFYRTAGFGENAVRFAFPKKLETLAEAGARMHRGINQDTSRRLEGISTKGSIK
ncbi:MAG: aminotransferase class I/II-fold pyridoxal phosphate-dependent enzyme [Chloroflexi bacterium]|nr:aminotransferase class I/II-fold pyridoxal phosphate-dependent enzyme [Chloroflexota bacterium]